jgi:hypothetical protein
MDETMEVGETVEVRETMEVRETVEVEIADFEDGTRMAGSSSET